MAGIDLMQQHLQSKTVAGLAVLLITVVGLSAFHLLTEQAVEAIKWIGGAYMSVRVIANLPANQPQVKIEDTSKQDR